MNLAPYTLHVPLGSLTKPQVVSLSLDFVENTNSTTLTCQTLNEEVGVRWFVGGQPLLPSERLVLSTDNRTLEIRSLWRDDSGSYQCEIWTGALQAWSDPFELTVSCELLGSGISLPPPPPYPSGSPGSSCPHPAVPGVNVGTVNDLVPALRGLHL